jgi:hypothetical protein
MFAALEIDAEEFRRRRALAMRNGSAAWLWPEVSVASWSEATKLISNATAAILAGENAVLPPSEPMALSLASYTSGVGPLLGWWCQSGNLQTDAQTTALLALHLEHGRARAERVEAQSKEVVRILRQSGISVIVLKGGHTAHAYFPDPATRPASDLDLLVPADQAPGAEAALAEAGLRCLGRGARESSWMTPCERREPRSLWLVHTDDPWSIDLHSSLDFSGSPGASVVRLDSAEPFASRETWALDSKAGILQQPLLLLHLAVHASGGLHSLTLLRMIEIVLVLRQDAAIGRLSWDDFVALGERTNGLGAAYPALRMCETLAPGTVPTNVLECSAAAAPRRARTIVDRLEPSTAQRIDRASIGEHFMWVTGVPGWIRQLKSDLAPQESLWPIYQARAYRLLRGSISR